MLILHPSREPFSSQPSRIDDHKIRVRNRIMHKSSHKIGKLSFPISRRHQMDLILHNIFEERQHFRQPLLLENGIDFRMRKYIFVVEAVRHQLPSYLKFIGWHVLACAEIGENLLANCNGPFDNFLDQGCFVELEIEHVEVITSIDGPTVRNA